MGCWGFGLFQSDSDLDLIGEIDGIAQAHLPSDSSLQYPENRDAVRDALDGGALSQILPHFSNSPPATVYTIVMAMQLGCKISDEQRKTLGKQVKKGMFYDVAQQQVERAVKEYPNDGTPWEFNSVGLLDTMSLKGAGVTDEQLDKFMVSGDTNELGLGQK
ncbi:hypothetical protein BCR35DRAFT_330490 [Leucosporidium creatinivorum]|uniref:Uncharacterized protein n=1 Tax=Leucosporidium creatinivorum TaxID=106004 RepID=A0A1Y2FU10_9BASI|nr:hypothetical protein BCR35DRAFT_330490 [Leucosporidium creatinivorum]